MAFLFSFILAAYPSSCRGNVLQDTIHSVGVWARHELSAMFQLARPISAGECHRCGLSSRLKARQHSTVSAFSKWPDLLY